MSNTRIKDLTTGVPTGAEFLPYDSTGTGTKKATAADVVQSSLRTTVFDDLSTTSGWSKNAVNNGAAQWYDSLTAQSFSSSGVVVLVATVDANSAYSLFRYKAGCVFGTNKPIVVRWRLLMGDAPAAAGTGLAYAGLTSMDAGVNGIAVRCTRAYGSADAWHLITTRNSVQTVESISWPAGTYFDVRLTVSPTGTVVEVSADDGAFSTVLTSSTAPNAAVYVPLAAVANSSGAGKISMALDYVLVSMDRTATNCGSFYDDGIAFPI